MANVRVGFIGCGGIANGKHFPGMAQQEGVDMCAFCDLILERAEKAAKEYGTPDAKVYTDYHELLADPTIDAVHVLTPNVAHCEITVAALEAGKHVLCEKPMAATPADAKKMLEARDRTGKMLTIGYQYRHFPENQVAKKVVDSGALGDVYYAEATYLRRRGVPTWGVFTDKAKQGGGPLIDIGAHMLDLAACLLDYPEVSYVCASSSDLIGKQGGTGFMGSWDGARFGVEDGLFGFIRFSNGGSLHIRTSFAVNIADKEERNVRLYGSKRGISVFPLEIYGDEDGQSVNAGYPFDETKDWHYDCIRNFVESCMGRADILVTPDQAVYVQKLITGLYRSAGTGRPVIYGNGYL